MFFNWGVVQLAERPAVTREVAGSSPAAPAKLSRKILLIKAIVAQLVEQCSCKAPVGGSSPLSGSL